MGKRKRNTPKPKIEGSTRKRKRTMFPKPQIPEDIIFDVLKRLPAKSLMQFKSVCKAWHALICDPFFAKSHFIYSQTRPDASYMLFYIRTDSLNARAIFPTNPDAVFSTQLSTYTFDDVESAPCTNIVNGCICVYDGNMGNVELLNLTTREKIALPWKVSLPSDRDNQFYRPKYFLGFDPGSNQYKVLYFRRRRVQGQIHHEGSIRVCYIHTLGTKTWRKINDTPQLRLVEGTISVNGAIYWKDRLFMNGERVIQFFDVREEKFLLLFPPKQRGKEIKYLTEVKGNFALGYVRSNSGLHPRVLTLWTKKSDDLVWVKDVIRLPTKLISEHDLKLVGSANTGEILFTTKLYLDDSWTTLIFYNLRTKKCRTRKITLPLQPASACTLLSLVARIAVSHQVENIFPLRPPIDQQKKLAEKPKKRKLAKKAKAKELYHRNKNSSFRMSNFLRV